MDILFWSGGKDAFLAHEFYRRSHPGTALHLLTTYDEKRKIVPHQCIPLDNVKQQAAALGLDLILVGLPPKCPNEIYLGKLKETLEYQRPAVKTLIFGDWHLQDIRNWREDQFAKLGYKCHFPIWKKKLDELVTELLLKPVEIRISAVASDYKKYIRVGERFDQSFIRQLPNEIDPFGENGEFHTEVVFKAWDQEHSLLNQPL